MYSQNEPCFKSLSQTEIAQKVISQWFDLLENGDVESICALYSSEADFLPTFSPLFVRNPDGVHQYFHHFISKHPKGKIVEESIRFLSDDCFIHAGLYNFEVGPVSDRTIVHARYTYVWRICADNYWKIIHHHSSALPA